jgi:hypothetical protein
MREDESAAVGAALQSAIVLAGATGSDPVQSCRSISGSSAAFGNRPHM